MPIDWFTVAAQALNFGALLWLLKRFLYGPILQAVDAREKRIADELADAAAQQEKARQERDAYALKNSQFEQQRQEMLDKAQAQATEQGQQWLAQAREAASAWTTKRLATLSAQALQIDGIIRDQAQQEIFAITRKAISELADADLEQRMCEVFARRLRDADGAVRAAMAKALKADPDAVQVRSAFVLGEPAQKLVEDALRDALGLQQAVRFVAAPELVCGIELVGGSQKIGWNVAEYFEAMEQRLAELM
ncbi:MAG: F0F1 ATP synthase subunit B, partial [Burkholderiaceae bacterium]